METFFVCLGVCIEFDFAVFLEINNGHRHERFRRNHAEHAAFYRETVDPENSIFHHAGDHSIWEFFVG